MDNQRTLGLGLVLAGLLLILVGLVTARTAVPDVTEPEPTEGFGLHAHAYGLTTLGVTAVGAMAAVLGVALVGTALPRR